MKTLFKTFFNGHVVVWGGRAIQLGFTVELWYVCIWLPFVNISFDRQIYPLEND